MDSAYLHLSLLQ